MKLAHYESALAQLAASLPAPERAAREELLAKFLAKGFPHKKVEDWRYTDVTALADKAYALPASVSRDLSAETLPGSALHAFINGHGAAASPREPKAGGVTELNAAFARSGYTLELAAGKLLEQPQQVLTWCEGAGPAMAHLRHRIVLGANAQATVIMQHGGQDEYLTTQMTDIELGAGAKLTLYRVQDEAVNSHHLAQTDARLARDARLEVVTVDLGAGLARHDLNVVLAEPGASVEMHGLFAPAHGAHVDNHLRTEHRAPHCMSRQFFRGVVNEQTKAVFNGKVYVAEGASKTDSEQRIANLLLSPKAEVNAKPELEIYNDDVKCAHGATFGQLDEDAIYYLRARGVGKDAARALLTYSFAREVLDHITHEDLRRRATARLLEHLPRSKLLEALL